MHIIAVENGIVLGAAQLKLREMDIYPDKEYWLGSVIVAPNARGRGTASALAKKTADAARSFGIKTLYRQTEKLDGGGLYAKLGWQPIERVHYNGADVLAMQKGLWL